MSKLEHLTILEATDHMETFKVICKFNLGPSVTHCKIWTLKNWEIQKRKIKYFNSKILRNSFLLFYTKSPSVTKFFDHEYTEKCFLCLRRVLEKDSSLNLAIVVGVIEWFGTRTRELLGIPFIALGGKLISDKSLCLLWIWNLWQT